MKNLGRRVGINLEDWETDSIARLADLLRSGPRNWPVQATIRWKRRIGGRQGVQVELPPGTYSDDTQLRLATSRCIHNGRFQPEQFAFVELPTFTSYGLGGGHATKSGAAAMAKANASWPTPDYRDWANAGGNGVVMRVSPISFAAVANGVGYRDMLSDVVKNGVITHGHPRALLPACLHAYALARTIEQGKLAPVAHLHEWIDDLATVPHLMADDPELASTLRRWAQENSGRDFRAQWDVTCLEMHDLVEVFRKSPPGDVFGYVRAAERAGLFRKATLGVGTSTFVAAYWLAETFQDDPTRGLLLAANAVGTDTDTVATIAGAHLGTVRPYADPSPLLDRDYIEAETLRTVAPRHRNAASPPTFPDLEDWRAPKTQADYFGIDPRSGRSAVAGLGTGEVVSAAFPAPGAEFAWQWFQTDFGQSLLIKRRADLQVLPASALPRIETLGTPGSPTVERSDELDALRARAQRASNAARTSTASSEEKRRRSSAVDPSREPVAERARLDDTPLTIDGAIARAEMANFDDRVVGELLRELARDASRDAAATFLGYLLRTWRR